MFLRPRHVSAAVVSSTAIAEDGKPASLASIEEEVGELLPPAAADTKRRQRSVLRQIRFRCQNLNLRLHLCGVTRSRRKAMLTLCGGWCLLSMCTVLLFALLRTMAMVSIVPSAGSTVDDGGQMFTVLVNTFERPRQLEEAVQHYAKCEGVESVRVAWSEQSAPPDAATNPQLFDHPRPVKIHAYPTTSINNRFIPPTNLLTEAVFVVDDDISVPCGHLRSAFQTWQQHPDTLVGFFPRSHAHQPSSPRNQGKEDGGQWEYLYFWRVLWNMEYSIVLTKAAFVHAKYLELYGSGSGSGSDKRVDARVGDAGSGSTDSDWSVAMVDAMVKTRAYVDSHRNCEDIAMQMAVTSVSGLPPVAAFAPVVDIGLFGGISTGEGSGRWWHAPHAVKRSRCLADLHEIFCAARATDAPLLAPSASNGDGSRHTAMPGEAKPAPRHCEALIRTDLFAATATTPASIAPRIRGGFRQTSDSGDGVGLSRLSRWGLALRAPTIAEFFSADMLLVPTRLWKWFAKDDVFGRA